MANPRTSALPAGPARGLAVFMGAMTTLWSLIIAAASAPLALLGAVLGAVVAVAGLLVGRAGRGRRDSGDAVDRGPRSVRGRGRPEGSRTFTVAVIAEVVVGVTVILVLGRTGRGDYVLPAIALVVALHFFVFLSTQRLWIHAVAGLCGTAGSLLAIALMATGSVGTATGHATAAGALAACTLGYGVAFLRVSAGARDGGPALGTGRADWTS